MGIAMYSKPLPLHHMQIRKYLPKFIRYNRRGALLFFICSLILILGSTIIEGLGVSYPAMNIYTLVVAILFLELHLIMFFGKTIPFSYAYYIKRYLFFKTLEIDLFLYRNVSFRELLYMGTNEDYFYLPLFYSESNYIKIARNKLKPKYRIETLKRKEYSETTIELLEYLLIKDDIMTQYEKWIDGGMQPPMLFNKTKV